MICKGYGFQAHVCIAGDIRAFKTAPLSFSHNLHHETPRFLGFPRFKTVK